MSDMMLFADDDTPETKPREDAWKLFIVDDDKDIHEITKLALKDLKFKDKTISFESAFSAEEAINELKTNPKFAIVLLDIGMETSDAGLEVANFIRKQLNDNLTRIIIRTGQPGETPEREIIDDYDINDFKSKTELTIERLFSTIRTAIAQYDQINELAKLNAELEERIERALIAQEEQQKALMLQDRTVQMGELLNMLAHQWRQPLSRISAVTSQLKFSLALGELNTEEFDKQVDSIEKYTDELSHTIDEFRAVYKPSETDKKVPLCELLDKAVSIINASFNNDTIQIHLDCATDDRKHFVSTALYQVILNLLKNSEEAFIGQEIEDPNINISFSFLDDAIKIYIADNAGGINEEDLERIFEPYFSTKEKRNGHGLGLYMSKNILEQHCDGKIEVKNTSAGACFTITLANK